MTELTLRAAGVGDVTLLAEMNKHLIEDEGHRNTMDIPALQKRMVTWLESAKYRAQIFESDGKTVGYCLYKEEQDYIYLRQFFVGREFRRCGFGTAALALLTQLWHGRRLSADVLARNQTGLRFWQASGFSEYARLLERLLPGEAVIRHVTRAGASNELSYLSTAFSASVSVIKRRSS